LRGVNSAKIFATYIRNYFQIQGFKLGHTPSQNGRPPLPPGEERKARPNYSGSGLTLWLSGEVPASYQQSFRVALYTLETRSVAYTSVRSVVAKVE